MYSQIDTYGNDFSIWHIDNDINGNARYVVHYLAIPFAEDADQPYHINQSNCIGAARQALGGKRYRAKWFGGGGIVFQAYAGDPVKHVLAAIKSAETGASFTDTFKSLNKLKLIPMTVYRCQLCDHVYGASFPSQPVVQLHHTVSHGVNDKYIYAI